MSQGVFLRDIELYFLVIGWWPDALADDCNRATTPKVTQSPAKAYFLGSMSQYTCMLSRLTVQKRQFIKSRSVTNLICEWSFHERRNTQRIHQKLERAFNMLCYVKANVKCKFRIDSIFFSAVEGMRKESRIFNRSRYLAILLYVYQGQMLSHPTGQWFRRQLCCLKSWITREQCHHRAIADS